MMLILPKDLQNQKKVKKEKNALTIKNAVIQSNGRGKILNTFKSGIFPKTKQEKNLKVFHI